MSPIVCCSHAPAAWRSLQVRYDPDKVGPRALIQALSDAGYEAEPTDEQRADGAALRDKEKR